MSPHTCQSGYHQYIKKQVLVWIWRKVNAHEPLVGIQVVIATMETVWRFPPKLKIELFYEPRIPLLGSGLYMYKPKTLIQKYICTPMFTAVLFTIVSNGSKPNAQP